MNVAFYIARRYLVSKKSQNAISIVSTISVIGVSVGTMALIIVLSAFNGLSDLVKSLYNSFNADMEITIKQGNIFHLNDTIVNDLKKIEGVVYYSEILEDNALVKYKSQQCFATIRGVSKSFLPMSRFDTLVRDGNYLLNNGEHATAVLGKGVAYQLNLNLGDQSSPITAFVPRRGYASAINPDDAFTKRTALPSGIFSINDDFDYKYILVDIDFARDLLDYKNEVSAIDLGIKKGSNYEKIESEIRRIIGPQFVVRNKYEQNELLFKTLKSEKLWTFIILLFILIIATFNVIGSLTMLILEKKKDLHILWDLGADRGLIRRIFIYEGLLITLVGVGSGLLLGTLICLGQQHFAWIKFNDSFVVSAYPIKLMLSDYMMVLGCVMLIGTIAAWYPVRVFTKRYFESSRVKV